MKAQGGRVVLSSLLFALITFQGEGMKLTLDFEKISASTDVSYSQLLTCTGVGDDVTINSMTLARIRPTSATTELLVLTEDSPLGEVVFGNIRGTGSLEKNAALAKLKLLSKMPETPVDFYTCQSTYTNASGGAETAFTMVGPGMGNLPSQWQGTEKLTTQINTPEVSNYGCSVDFACSSTELGYFNDRIARIEQKVDALDEKMSSNLDRYSQRLGTLETEAHVKVGTVEANLSLRLSRLEDKLSSLLTGTATGSEGEGQDQLEELERQIDDLTARLNRMNGSRVSRDQDKPTVCERGMGDDVSKDYPRYAVLHNNDIKTDILCDTHTDGGGWIVFHRRSAGDLDFYRDWTSYREGFGSLTGDFWLGNEAIHQLTDGEAYELRVDTRFKGQELFAAYSSFRLESEANKYSLKIGSFSGTASDALAAHRNYPFSTFDRENDIHNTLNCATHAHGAWWYYKCLDSNLNGKWGHKEPTGNVWGWKKGAEPVSFSEMKIRRIKDPRIE